MTDGAEPEGDLIDYDSGPFCRHWGDPGDCDELCSCGHKCCRHPWGGCEEPGCECDKWKEREEQAT